MNIQIFGKSKCFDTKKAERYFKERRVKFQAVDLLKYGMSRGELLSVIRAVGLDAVIDQKHPDAPLLNYLAYDDAKLEKLVEDPRLLKTPIVRNGKLATVGYQPEVWKSWEP
ncbi:ArsC family transcriptional regulator [Oscillospiraceae bacterium]|nr:ArsC family transcriptional regulator [Oscillospiraceae bacterium]